MAQFDLKTYARRGAELRAQELLAELATIYQAFPDLRRRSAMGPGRESEAGNAKASAARRRRRRSMSAAQRRAVSLRMKKYWAERRKAR